jgi:hypothetical protein
MTTLTISAEPHKILTKALNNFELNAFTVGKESKFVNIPL